MSVIYEKISEKYFDYTGNLIQESSEYSPEVAVSVGFMEKNCIGKGKKDENGLKQGKWVYINKTTKNLNIIAHYKNDNFDGEYISLWNNGQLGEKGKYENNKRVGVWREYHRNGNIEEECEYVNGERNGECINYYLEGTILGKGRYENGYKIDEWTFYDREGNLESKGKFHNGKKFGTWNYYHNGDVYNAERYDLKGNKENFDVDSYSSYDYGSIPVLSASEEATLLFSLPRALGVHLTAPDVHRSFRENIRGRC